MIKVRRLIASQDKAKRYSAMKLRDSTDYIKGDHESVYTQGRHSFESRGSYNKPKISPSFRTRVQAQVFTKKEDHRGCMSVTCQYKST